MASEDKVEWTHIRGGGELYNVTMQHVISGRAHSSDDRKLIENIPTYAAECLKCGKLHRFASLLKACPNCSSPDYIFGGRPSHLVIGCGRCSNAILESVRCQCGCVNALNGSTLRQPKTGGCFIATAVYGSPLAPEVMTFRQFRDDVLVPSKLGRAGIRFYYLVSPTMAAVVSRHVVLRSITRRLLLEPILRLIKQ